MLGNYVLFCSNTDCESIKIVFTNQLEGNHKKPLCSYCRKKTITAIPISGSITDCKTLFDNELSNRSEDIRWLDKDQLDQWPGPIAFEYVRLKEILSEGEVEAACWKLMNFVEVTTNYLVSAVFESSSYNSLEMMGNISSIGHKIVFIENSQKRDLEDILRLLKNIKNWRNKFGVGHGSLVTNKELYVDHVMNFCNQINITFKYFGAILKSNRFTLKAYNEHDKSESLLGPDYFFKLKGENWTVKPYCCDGSNIQELTVTPIKIFSYQFDPPDLYFFDNYSNGVIQFRNFSKNRMKYFSLRNQRIEWYKDPGQVAWLNRKERESWIGYYNNNYASEELLEIMVDAAEQFYKRGMFEDARFCINEFKNRVNKNNSYIELDIRILLIEYALDSKTGKKNDAERTLAEINKLLKNLKDVRKREFNHAEIALEDSWNLSFSGEHLNAVERCDDAIERLDKIYRKYPYTKLLKEIELLKNRLYITKRISDQQTKKELKRLGNESLKLFAYCCAAHNNDPHNNTIVDIMGFACNLYGDYQILLMERGQALSYDDKQCIMNLCYIGKKIREKFYKIYPDDVWVIRGYTWSIHSEARFMKSLYNDVKKAEALFRQALEIRLRGKERFPEDTGLKEDIEKNKNELAELDNLNP